ncbi:hypothetical protein CUJ84_pRLN1000850 (plasmid) [Rhizobium leguminosarum]|uniref:Uncharacterized protein n=1 Tax=Rhizobium leguminosarum TaxID=384 RepID=A0A2K9ZDH2_RHILE|nr:hypothetical protein CUJ84_pRLN1000850 [Rhizobium leguminosarum]
MFIGRGTLSANVSLWGFYTFSDHELPVN